MPQVSLIRLLEVDPDLGSGIGPDDLEEAQRLVLGWRQSLWPGSWDPRGTGPRLSGRFAMLVLDGMLGRERLLSEGVHAEIFGPGDVLDPWSEDEGMVPTRLRWTVISPSEVAVLDRHFLLAVRRWPILALRLFERMAGEHGRLSVQASINAVPHADKRILAMLWHLASLYGTVRADGRFIVPVRLTHEAIGRLVRARRPTVTRAMKRLCEQGLVEVEGRGAIVLSEGSRALLDDGRTGLPSLTGRGFEVLEPLGGARTAAGSSSDRSQRLATEVSLLRASEADYRAMFELAALGVALVELPTGTLLRLNERFAEIAGATIESLVGSVLWDRVHPDDAPRVRGQIASLLEGESRQAYVENRYVRGDGALAWTRTSLALVRPDARGPERLMVIVEDIAEQKRAAEARDAAERELSAELEGMRSLHDLSTRVAEAAGLPEMLERVLAGMMALHGTVYGNVQLHDAESNTLTLVAQHGFTEEFVEHFRIVDASDGTSCGRALALGAPVLVEDVHRDPAYAPYRFWAMQAGYRGVYSVPLLRRDGELIGVVSTHFTRPRRLSERERRLTDLFVHFAVELIQRAQAEEQAAADLSDIELLRDLGARLVGRSDLPSLLDEIVAAALTLARADAGTVQLLDEPSQELVLSAVRGFDESMTEAFARVDASSGTPCGAALRERRRVLVDYDAPGPECDEHSSDLHLRAGYCTGQSTPLVTRTGAAIGMLTTHWRTRHRPTAWEQHLIDLLARQAADLIALAGGESLSGSAGGRSRRSGRPASRRPTDPPGADRALDVGA